MLMYMYLSVKDNERIYMHKHVKKSSKVCIKVQFIHLNKKPLLYDYR